MPRFKHYQAEQFKEPSLSGLPAPRKQLATVPVRRQSWRKGRCELGFWRSISKEDGRFIIGAAQRYEEHTRNPGERIGPLGPIGVEILKLFVNLAIAGSCRVEPQLTWIMSKVRRSKCAVVAALARLRDHGFIDWRRRYVPTGNEGLGPQVKQTSNAYRINIETAKRIVSDFEKPSPLPDDLAQTRDEREARALAWNAAVNQSDQRESAERAETSPISYSKEDYENGRPVKEPDGDPTGCFERFQNANLHPADGRMPRQRASFCKASPILAFEKPEGISRFVNWRRGSEEWSAKAGGSRPGSGKSYYAVEGGVDCLRPSRLPEHNTPHLPQGLAPAANTPLLSGGRLENLSFTQAGDGGRCLLLPKQSFAHLPLRAASLLRAPCRRFLAKIVFPFDPTTHAAPEGRRCFAFAGNSIPTPLTRSNRKAITAISRRKGGEFSRALKERRIVFFATLSTWRLRFHDRRNTIEVRLS